MKRLILIISIVFLTLVAYSQSEAVLPLKGTSADTDTLRVVKDGESALMLKSTFLSGYEPYTFGSGLTLNAGLVTLNDFAFDTDVYLYSATNDFHISSSIADIITTSALSLIAGSGNKKALYLSPAVANGIYVDDDIDGIGLRGADYYGGIVNDNSYAQQKYVDDAVAAGGGVSSFLALDDTPSAYFGYGGYLALVNGAENALEFGIGYAAGNGLSLTGTPLNGVTFKVEGIITEDLTLETTTLTDAIKLRGAYSASSRSAQLNIVAGALYLDAFENSTYSSTNYARIRLQNAGIFLGYTAFTSSISLELTSLGGVIRDDLNGRGLENYADYSASAGPRNIIDKAHVEALILASPGTGLWLSNTPDIYFNTGDVGIGVTSPTGALDVVSTDGAFIPPRMTTAQRTALAAIEGSVVYDTDVDALFSYRNSAWGQIASGTPVVGGDILILKSDVHNFPFGLGNGDTGDDALFAVGAETGVWQESRAIADPESFGAYVEGTSASATVQIYYNATDPQGAGTAVLTTPMALTVAGGYTTTTSFDVATIPKGSFIWCEVTAVTTAPTKFRGFFNFSFD